MFEHYNFKNTQLTVREIVEIELNNWIASTELKDKVTGIKYYLGKHDILERKRTAIGKSGNLEVIENLPNNRIVDNLYATMVDQKGNYLLSNPVAFESDDTAYVDRISETLGDEFDMLMRRVAISALNTGIAWLYPYVENNQLKFNLFSGTEILPFWRDESHTDLEMAVRLYEIDVYTGHRKEIVKKVEVYTSDGVEFFEYKDNKLKADAEKKPEKYYNVKSLTWGKIPLIAFRYNTEEMPLINRVKAIQDSINETISDFRNDMQENARNTILVIENYDDEDLSLFRHNINAFGAVKVKSTKEARGGVTPLYIQTDKDAYITSLATLKKSLISNARGYDAKDERMNNNPNQMNIQSMYSDIDLDANGMEAEFKAALKQLLYFVNIYLGIKPHDDIKIIFNRDVLINESQAITDCKASYGLISDETVLANHPWVDSVDDELTRLEETEKLNEYADAFVQDDAHGEEE